MLSMVYVIVIYNMLHQQQGMLPERYPDQQTCQVALSQKTFGFTYWGQCKPIGLAPTPLPQARPRR